jgi:hypothetical protein
MSKRTRALILGATLAAVNLAGLTAVAHAQATNEAKDARQPPSEGQVGETWRHSQAASPQQTAADATLQRQLARERHSIPSGTPAPVPADPNGQPGWLLASLSVLTVVLALVGGLAVLAAKRAGRRARVGHAA